LNGVNSGARPGEGLNPVIPQNEAGSLFEPPISDPVASIAVPAASAAAEPPLDPPGAYARCHGLRVTPHSLVQVTGAQQNSGVVVCACTMPPASMIRCTNGAVCEGTSPRNGGDPRVLGLPAIDASSFTATGSPSSGRASPAR
jgi:hypothetical protein